ncbi:mono/diheme cytochrome c family protein [Aquimarina sp. EL_43]|uniref:c-type cytochrome n=1 Tax=Aquimarina TaxID=290174 RepID=UPI00046F8632|nr:MULTISPECIES: cytochrome c [Aquimarina]MBG6132990.1 mono/diheme cytochrome c family protein [Aquimarina sp. EL_35]MBG6152301.1 mono/diheme cytochrome c family protein [Aquimarina sp. EL_32]MBG6171139.1 mono/diheme cytochrome c family protein [Aquimarina sp. EL_43]
MKNTIKILATAVVMICVVSCKKDSKPNYQFMPNMYEPLSYETYGDYGIFPGGQEAMLPAEGSIPRGWMPYDFENSQEGYLLAKDTLKNPIRYTKENEDAGKELYDIYCAICHGGKGDGKGPLVQREKILGVPSYDDIGRAITEGSIYHVMYYGINSMGSYASQTNEHERWQIVQYVQKLKADLEGKTPRIDTDAAPTVVETKVEEHPESTEDHSNAH